MVDSEVVSEGTLDDFIAITKFDCKEYFYYYAMFMENHVGNIYDFYSGFLKQYPANSFSVFNELRRRTAQILDVFKANSNSLATYEYWVMLELVEDINTRLDTIGNFSKWARSAIRAGHYSAGMQIEYVQQEGQNLESIVNSIENKDDPQNDWVALALKNDLREEGYTPSGGMVVKAGTDNPSVFLNSVVDNLDSIAKTCGLDIDRNLTFVDNDLATLGYKDTIEQAADILFGLRKGDNPFFADQGIEPTVVVGNSMSAANYPILVRQLQATVLRDDTFSSVELVKLEKISDGSYLTFDVKTSGGMLLKQGILIK